LAAGGHGAKAGVVRGAAGPERSVARARGTGGVRMGSFGAMGMIARHQTSYLKAKCL